MVTFGDGYATNLILWAFTVQRLHSKVITLHNHTRELNEKAFIYIVTEISFWHVSYGCLVKNADTTYHQTSLSGYNFICL